MQQIGLRRREEENKPSAGVSDLCRHHPRPRPRFAVTDADHAAGACSFSRAAARRHRRRDCPRLPGR